LAPLASIERVWGTFESHFTELWKDHVQDPVLRDEGFRSWYLNRTLCEAIGFAGAEVIRRTIGLAHVQDLDGIEDEQRREAARKFALRIGRWAILKAGEFHSVDQFTHGLQCLL
jgi:5-methylthioribose kinase